MASCRTLLTPGDDPFRALANALPDLDAFGQLRSDVRNASVLDLRRGTGGLYNQVASLVKQAGERTLIVIDQFEELFSLAPESEREEQKQRTLSKQKRFIDSLLAAADAGGDRRVYITITLRADFYARCFQHPSLPGRMSANQYAVQRMSREQLREVIEKPLVLAGAKPDPDLVETILEDAGDAPGNLPLLEHTLFRLWGRRTTQKLTLDSYRAVGGLKGALREHADELYGNLGPEEKSAAARIFVRLTQLGEGTEDTRRRAQLDELVSKGGDPQITLKVLKRLETARLVTTSGDVASQQPGEETFVEVAHETLIREWPELRRWIEDNRDTIRTGRKVEAAARQWGEANDEAKPLFLYLETRLAEAADWAKVETGLPDFVDEFLKASRLAQDEKKQDTLISSIGLGAALGASITLTCSAGFAVLLGSGLWGIHYPTSDIARIGVCTSLPTTPHLVVGRSACRVGVRPSLNRSWAQRSRPVVQAGRRAFPGDESVVD